MLQFRQDWWQGVRQDGEINCDIAKDSHVAERNIKKIITKYFKEQE